jgi:hypothetical protein
MRVRIYTTNHPKIPHEIASISVEKAFVFHCFVCDRLSPIGSLRQNRDPPLRHLPETRLPRQRIEGIGVRASHPRLRAKSQNFLE